MEINSNLNLGGLNGLPPATPSANGAKPIAGTDSFTNSAELEGALGNTPDVRADVVDNARSLVNNSGYPNGDTIKTLSNFLASKLQSGQD